MLINYFQDKEGRSRQDLMAYILFILKNSILNLLRAKSKTKEPAS